MFFPERITSIKETDLVLEIGPGSSPHPRSDVLLEKSFSAEILEKQNGFNGTLVTEKKVVYYDGGKFPFKDYEFDYVICSHVLEHIPVSEIKDFLKEIQRVSRKGYLEFPTIYYEYLYNFEVHVTLLKYAGGVIIFYPKESSGIDSFSKVHEFFYSTAIRGYSSLIDDLKPYFFQGFEWFDNIKIKEAKSFHEICFSLDEISKMPFCREHIIKDKISMIKRFSTRFKHFKKWVLKK